MKDDPKQILINVLESIEYAGDKEKVATQFILLCESKALSNLILELQTDEQDEIGERVKNITDPLEAQKLFKSFFTEEQYVQALREATQDNFRMYFDSIFPTLTDKQRVKLLAYIDSLNTQE